MNKFWRGTAAYKAISICILLTTLGVGRLQAEAEFFVDSTNPAICARPIRLLDAYDLGQRPSAALMEIVLTLRFNHPNRLSQLLRDQNDPNSGHYHEYLTAAEFSERFGPTAAQLATVTSELQRAGFQITECASNRMLVHATAPTATVEQYFGTEIHSVSQGDSLDRYLNVKTGLLPNALIGLVKAVHFDNVIVYKPIVHSQAITGPILGPDAGNTPVALADFFDFPVQHRADGTGQTAAVIIDSDVSDADLNTFFAYFPITRTGTITRESVNGGEIGGINGDADETALDVETIAALAPGANVIIYIMPGLGYISVDDAANQIVSDNKASVVNMSFGAPEVSDPTFESALMQGNAQGITFVAASGDYGSAYLITPASEPRVLAVGGTIIYYTPPDKFTEAWNLSTGGVSRVFSIPGYQKGISGVASETQRNVPDVAYPAEGADIVLNGQWTLIDGTSWSSPTYVALQLELNQVKHRRAGWVNHSIYQVFKKSGYKDFYPIKRGSNGSYNAAYGYNNVCGIGSPIGEALATDPTF